MYKQQLIKATGLIISAFIITSCATLPAEKKPKNQVIARPKRQQQLSDISRFTINGAVAAKQANNGFTASLHWQQSSSAYFTVRLFGPFGAGNVVMSSQGKGVTLQDKTGKVHGSSAEKLLKKQTGYYLPLHQMYFWVRGLSAPGADANKRFDRYNHLSVLKQAGWTINYLRYTAKNGIDLPSKITLYSQGVKIKLVIRQWQL